MRPFPLQKFTFSSTKPVWVAAGAAAVAALLVLGACSDAVVSKIAAPKDLTPRFGVQGSIHHKILVCVDASSDPGPGPGNTYSFSVAANTQPGGDLALFESAIFGPDPFQPGIIQTNLGPFIPGDIITTSVNVAPGDPCAEVFVRMNTCPGGVCLGIDPYENLGNRLWSGGPFGPKVINPPGAVSITATNLSGFSFLLSCTNDDIELPQSCVNGGYSSANVFHGSSFNYTFTALETPCPAGSFDWDIATATSVPGYPDGAVGDILIKYDQFPAPNDNSYGVNAVGWPNGHTFSNLTGSDKAGVLIALNGVVKLSFNMDYLSSFAGAPSGYKSLGVTGGDGSMLIGTSAGISVTTSLANNLNNINIPGLFNAGTHAQLIMGASNTNVLVNSPPTDPAHLTYNISDAAFSNWDFHDTYYARVSPSNPALAGFSGATKLNPNGWTVVPNLTVLHNSPAKPCPNPAGACNVAVTKTETKDKQVKITIRNNNTTTETFLTALNLTWPQGTNGNLTQIKLDGDVIYNGPAIGGGGASLTLADLVADPNKRKINKNSSDVLTLIFANNVSSTLSSYSISKAFFGNDCVLNILP